MLDDERWNRISASFRVLSAEAVARDLSAASIVVAGVEVAVGSAPEEPAHRSSSSLMKRASSLSV